MPVMKFAPIVVLFLLCGCTERHEASDPPAIGSTAEPVIAPAEMVADTPPAAQGGGEEEEEPRMASPVQFD